MSQYQCVTVHKYKDHAKNKPIRLRRMGVSKVYEVVEYPQAQKRFDLCKEVAEQQENIVQRVFGKNLLPPKYEVLDFFCQYYQESGMYLYTALVKFEQ